MNAQEKWLRLWRMHREAYKLKAEVRMYNLRDAMKREYRREAALERKLAAAEREIERLHEAAQISSMFDDQQVSKWFKKYRNLKKVAHNAVGHVGAANYPEREEEAHRWIDAA